MRVAAVKTRWMVKRDASVISAFAPRWCGRAVLQDSAIVVWISPPWSIGAPETGWFRHSFELASATRSVAVGSVRRAIYVMNDSGGFVRVSERAMGPILRSSGIEVESIRRRDLRGALRSQR